MIEGAHQAEDCAIRAKMVSVETPTSLHDLHVQQKKASRSLGEKPMKIHMKCGDAGC